MLSKEDSLREALKNSTAWFYRAVATLELSAPTLITGASTVSFLLWGVLRRYEFISRANEKAPHASLDVRSFVALSFALETEHQAALTVCTCIGPSVPTEVAFNLRHRRKSRRSGQQPLAYETAIVEGLLPAPCVQAAYPGGIHFPLPINLPELGANAGVLLVSKVTPANPDR